ncbi:MAG: UDP-3-O-(3-hydroxymyristoyl)glucosamine N-acyltransferase [Caulobacteraceae bacterium]|nr:UDP-3-O-(3-hydroxymyristoyl)glucosamine N-acyltransferase [Caulobacter sp.]
MPDSRFYLALGPTTVGDLARLTGAELVDAGDAERPIAGVAPLVRATAQDVGFLHDRRYVADLRASSAGAVFVLAAQADQSPPGCARLVTPEPLVAYAAAAEALHRPRILVASDPLLHPDAELEEDVELGPGSVVGAGVRIGRGTRVGANTVINPGVQLGRNCRVGANATLGFALIGDRVRILAGAVIGEEGFGVAGGRGGAVDVPQLGRVILQDGVSVGANTCIDRGAWEDTVVGENTKIDNLVQIAHNVVMGRNCLLAAHTGISGSCTVGDGVMFGGRAGIADHIDIGSGARIAAAAGVMKDVPAGEIYCGAPARPLRRFMRETAWLARNAKEREDLR